MTPWRNLSERIEQPQNVRLGMRDRWQTDREQIFNFFFLMSLTVLNRRISFRRHWQMIDDCQPFEVQDLLSSDARFNLKIVLFTLKRRSSTEATQLNNDSSCTDPPICTFPAGT